MNKLLKQRLIACFTVLISVNNLFAQDIWDRWADDEMKVNQWENWMEQVDEFRMNPLCINTATKQQLEKFPFLTDQLIENILYYLYKYGPMLSSNELMMVEGMDRQTAQNLLPFISFKQPVDKQRILSFKNLLKYGKHELSTRVDCPLNTKAGYMNSSREQLLQKPNSRYLGNSVYNNVRYQFKYGNHVYLGLTAEKDAGEPFFTGKNKKGYDYYSPYLLLKNIGHIKALAIGNYRLSYGQGLVMNTNFNLGKLASLSMWDRHSTGIKKHSSTDEFSYFQGVALSYQWSKRWTTDVFYSYRNMDGIVDSLFITSLKEDGMHRIPRDFEKKNTLSNQVIGSYIDYNGKSFECGLTGVYNVFNKVLKPKDRGYNHYAPQGKSFWNVGVHYKWFGNRWSISGETAVDKTGKFATLHMGRYQLAQGTNFFLMHRFYDAAYQSLYASAIGEGSTVQNESGCYVGIDTRLLKYVQLTAYGDFFYFPWKKYQVSKLGTKGVEGTLQLTYQRSKDWNLYFRYRFKQKEKDLHRGEEKRTLPYLQHKIKCQLTYQPNDNLRLKTSVDGVDHCFKGEKASLGYLVNQSIQYQWRKIPLQVSANGAWFHTDDYGSRITIYEKGVLYAFSMPSFYGEGYRFSAHLRYTWKDRIILETKYGLTHYQDRDHISSGLEEIQGNNKSDLSFQLRVKF